MLDQAEFTRRASQIRLLVLDVDGVLTDGSIVVDDAGREIKCFHVLDGFAIKCWQRSGRQLAVLSGRKSTAVDHRCNELGIQTVIQGQPMKARALLDLLIHFGYTAEQTCCIGDDLPELPLILTAGLGVAVADARAALRREADWVLQSAGGRGAVRELIELLLDAQGLWQPVLDFYRRPADSPEWGTAS